MRMIRYCFPIVVLAAAFMAGCSKPPDAEIQAARKSLEDARQAGADEYAQQSLKAAEDAVAELDAELKAQEDKFGLFRSYKVSGEKAAAAKAAAERAAADAQAGKDRAREEASTMLSEAKTALEEVKVALDSAPRGKGTAADLAAMKGDLAVAEQSLAEVDSMIADGRYKEAAAKASAAKANIEQVKMAIETATQTQGAARRQG